MVMCHDLGGGKIVAHDRTMFSGCQLMLARASRGKIYIGTPDGSMVWKPGVTSNDDR